MKHQMPPILQCDGVITLDEIDMRGQVTCAALHLHIGGELSRAASIFHVTRALMTRGDLLHARSAGDF